MIIIDENIRFDFFLDTYFIKTMNLKYISNTTIFILTPIFCDIQQYHNMSSFINFINCTPKYKKRIMHLILVFNVSNFK